MEKALRSVVAVAVVVVLLYGGYRLRRHLATVRAYKNQNERYAVKSIRDIKEAEQKYKAAHPDIGYTCRLEDLGPPPEKSQPDEKHAALIKAELATGQIRDYLYTFLDCPPMPRTNYHLLAVPFSSEAGSHAFCSTQADWIKSSSIGDAQVCFDHGNLVSPPAQK